MARYLEDDDVVAARVKRFAERIEPGVDVSEFPTSVTTRRVVEEMPKSVAAKIKRFGEVIEPGVPVSEYPTSILGEVPDEPVVEIPLDDPVDDPDDDPDDEPTVYPKAGTLLRYRASRTGFRIPIYADGKGGEYEGPEQADPDYDPNKGSGGPQFVEYEYSKDFKKRRAKFFNSATGTFTYGEWEDAPLTKEDFDKQQAATIAAEQALNEKRDAFALIESTMRSYGFSEEELKELTTYIQGGLLNPKLGPEQLVLQLRQLPVYKARFAGNEERRARGLNAISEANYLLQESAYAETMRQYGVQRFANRNQYATFIGNDISNTEVGKRVKTAVERLQMGDPAILRQLRTYYGITDSDIVSYFLNPKEVLPELEAKTTTAEIGATAGQFGLDTSLARASDLERYGVDLERARRGYGNIAPAVKEGRIISDIFKETGIDYTQTTAEQEEFKGLASARRARETLSGLQSAAFGKDAALVAGSLSTRRSGAY
jgi:hypothetical protein